MFKSLKTVGEVLEVLESPWILCIIARMNPVYSTAHGLQINFITEANTVNPDQTAPYGLATKLHEQKREGQQLSWIALKRVKLNAALRPHIRKILGRKNIGAL